MTDLRSPDRVAAAKEPLIRAVDISRTYDDGAVRALSNISLTVAHGEYLAIMGASGSGKSTLLNLLGTLDRPSSGEIYYEGQPLSAVRRLDKFRSDMLGFVFQSFYLLPTLTALENVQIPMFEGTLRPRERVRRAAELLAKVGLAHRARHLPGRLSVGERQRVAIARALANSPRLLLADEPTGNLDSASGAGVLDLFDQLHCAQGLTLVVITHGVDVAARANRVITIRDGQIVASHAPAAASVANEPL